MPPPPASRRKEDRSRDIVAAAEAEFLARGFAAARLEDVARRAGVAKGTVYLYFESKEALFEAVVRSAVVPHIAQAEAQTAGFEGSSADLLRLVLRTVARRMAENDTGAIIRLVIGEAGRFPELGEFYFREVVQRAMTAMRRIVARGVASGEFRATALDDYPQPLVAPLLVGLIWKSLFDRQAPLEFDALIEAHIDLVLNGLRADR